MVRFITRVYSVYCDAMVGADRNCPESFEQQGGTAQEARRAAEAEGWQTGIKDFCSRHRTPGWKRRA